MCVIRDNKLYTANIGDSRLIIAKEEGGMYVPDQITIDHKPDLPKEKERILKSGGRVYSITYAGGIVGPPRVFLKTMEIPGLAMSRSIGDSIAHSVGVTPTPDIVVRDLNVNDKAIILGSDGLWEFISNNDVSLLCSKYEHPKVFYKYN